MDIIISHDVHQEMDVPILSTQHRSAELLLLPPTGRKTRLPCDRCRKHKTKVLYRVFGTGQLLTSSECNGARPVCDKCEFKKRTCAYSERVDSMTGLRLRLKRITREMSDMKSILQLLVTTPDRTAATTWAAELERNGFQDYTAEDVRISLQVSGAINHRV